MFHGRRSHWDSAVDELDLTGLSIGPLQLASETSNAKNVVLKELTP